MKEAGGPWSIVLAGGKGERLSSLTERWLGRYVPKQYCTFVGTRSMLQHTLARARRLSSPDKIVTVVARDHAPWARAQVSGSLAAGLVHQPVNRDTAAGVFLPLARIRKLDPGATVAIFPADHFIHPEERFHEVVSAAVAAVDGLPQRLILLGTAPDGAEPDYGWIFGGRELDRAAGAPVLAVRSFLEKPSPERARAARVEGGLLNTMIMAAKVETLWRLGWRFLPEVMFRFDSLLEAVGTPLEAEATASIYRGMPQRNFSADLLQRARQEIAVLEMRGIHWSDWGRPERIAETLAGLGQRPAWEGTGPAPLGPAELAMVGA